MKHITPYNNEWPVRFSLVAKFLREHLPDTCFIHHIGSTSIPGMPSKDIIDLDIECPNGSMSSIIDSLDRAGYDHEGDKGIATREAFQPKVGSLAFNLPPHHLYACETQSPELFKHLAFREYLVSHPDRAKWLAREKIEKDQSAKSRSEYIINKSIIYEIITEESLAWANKALQWTPINGTAEF